MDRSGHYPTHRPRGLTSIIFRERWAFQHPRPMSATWPFPKAHEKHGGPYKPPCLRSQKTRKIMNHIVRNLTVSGALLAYASGAFAQCENKSGFAKLACQAQTNSNGPFQAA